MAAPALALLERLLASLGGIRDGEEPVDERTHALLCAERARRGGARPALVAAALLHDVGHSPLVPADRAGLAHEASGAAFLRPVLGEEVAWLVAMHVAAKAFLVRAEPGYAARLSPTSAASHERQLDRLGPPPSDHPLWPDALLLRRLDDAAKDPWAPTPDPAPILAIVAPLVHLRGSGPAREAQRSPKRVPQDEKSSPPRTSPVEEGSGPVPTITAKG